MLRFVVETAEVHELLGLGMRVPGAIEGGLKHVANGDDVLRGDVAEIRATAPADADRGDIQLLVEVSTAHHRRRGEGARGRRGQNAPKMPPRWSRHGQRVLTHHTGSFGGPRFLSTWPPASDTWEILASLSRAEGKGGTCGDAAAPLR